MKLAFSGLIVLGALGVLLLGERPDGALTTAGIEKPQGVHQYLIRVLGRDGNCKLTKLGPADAAQAEIELTQECFTLMPRLAEVRYWAEQKAGDVIFVAADGRKIAEFFPGDGVAYESSYPKSPLIALTRQ